MMTTASDRFVRKRLKKKFPRVKGAGRSLKAISDVDMGGYVSILPVSNIILKVLKIWLHFSRSSRVLFSAVKNQQI
jgi:hypothetical protein